MISSETEIPCESYSLTRILDVSRELIILPGLSPAQRITCLIPILKTSPITCLIPSFPALFKTRNISGNITVDGEPSKLFFKNPTGDDALVRNDSHFDANAIFEIVNQATSTDLLRLSTSGDLGLLAGSLDMENSNSIQDAGTDWLIPDGLANAIMPNGYLSIEDGIPNQPRYYGRLIGNGGTNPTNQVSFILLHDLSNPSSNELTDGTFYGKRGDTSLGEISGFRADVSAWLESDGNPAASVSYHTEGTNSVDFVTLTYNSTNYLALRYSFGSFQGPENIYFEGRHSSASESLTVLTGDGNVSNVSALGDNQVEKYAVNANKTVIEGGNLDLNSNNIQNAGSIDLTTGTGSSNGILFADQGGGTQPAIFINSSGEVVARDDDGNTTTLT